MPLPATTAGYYNATPATLAAAHDPAILDYMQQHDASAAGPLLQGWNSGGYQADAAAYRTGAIEALAANNIEKARIMERAAQMMEKQGGMWQPSVTDYRDVDGSNALPYALSGIAQGVRSSLPTMAGGAVGAGLSLATRGLVTPATGAFLGGLLPAAKMEYEESVNQSAQDPVITANNSAGDIIKTGLVKGTVNAVPEAVMPMLGGQTIAKAGKIALKRGLRNGLGAGVGGFMENSIPGAITEGLQNVSGQMAQNHLRGDPLGNIDIDEVYNDAIIGGLSEGTMAGGGATASHILGGIAGADGSLNKLADKLFAEKGKVADDAAAETEEGVLPEGMAEKVKAGVEKGKAAYEEFKNGARSAAKSAAEFAKDISDVYNEHGAGIAAATVEDSVKRKASDLYKDLEEIAKEKFGQGLDWVNAQLETNPFLKEAGMSSDKLNEFLDSHGKIAHTMLESMLQDDDFNEHATEETKKWARELYENPELLRSHKKQAQVAMIIHGMANNKEFLKRADDFLEELEFVQNEGGERTLYSKQSNADSVERASSVESFLSEYGIDKITAKMIAREAHKGDVESFDKAVYRHLVATNKLSDSNALEILKVLGLPQISREEAAPSRKNKRGTEYRLNDPQLSQAISIFVNDAVKGSEHNNSATRNSISRLIEATIAASRRKALTKDQLESFRASIGHYLGDRGEELLSRISTYEETVSGDTQLSDKNHRDNELRATTILRELSGGKLGTNESRALMRKLSVMYEDVKNTPSNARLEERVKAAKKEARDMLAKARTPEEVKQALALVEEANKAKVNDPYAAFRKEILKHFSQKVANRVEAVISGAQEQRTGIRTNKDVVRSTNNGGARGVNEALSDEDLEDLDMREDMGDASTALEEGVEKMQRTIANETGRNGEHNSQRFYGQSARRMGKYDGVTGAPLSLHATYEHPDGELASLMKEVEAENTGARINKINVWQYAERVRNALVESGEVAPDETAILSDIAKSVIDHDAEVRKKLISLLKTNKDLSRRKGSEVVSHSDVRESITDQLYFIEKRKQLYDNVQGDGAQFFAYKLTGHYRFIETDAATGEQLTIGEDELSRHEVVAGKAKQNAKDYALKKVGGSTRLATPSNSNKLMDEYLRSLVKLNKKEGGSITVDFAGLVGELMQRNQDGDISGVDTPRFMARLKGVVLSTITSLYTSEFLAENGGFENGPMFHVSGNFNEHMGTVGKFSLHPDQVVYRSVSEPRNPSSGRVYTYGQVFGLAGVSAARAESIKATKSALTKDELASIMPTKTSDSVYTDYITERFKNLNDQGIVDKLMSQQSAQQADSEKYVLSEGLIDASGNRRAFFPAVLLQIMMERHGMEPQENFPLFEEKSQYGGLSKKLTAALLTEGLAMLNRQGYSLAVGTSDRSLSKLVLWHGQHFDTTFGDVSKYIGAEYKGTYDLASDKIQAASERLVSAQTALEKLTGRKNDQDDSGFSNKYATPVTDRQILEAEEAVADAQEQLDFLLYGEYDDSRTGALRHGGGEIENARLGEVEREDNTLFGKSANGVFGRNADLAGRPLDVRMGFNPDPAIDTSRAVRNAVVAQKAAESKPRDFAAEQAERESALAKLRSIPKEVRKQMAKDKQLANDYKLALEILPTTIESKENNAAIDKHDAHVRLRNTADLRSLLDDVAKMMAAHGVIASQVSRTSIDASIEEARKQLMGNRSSYASAERAELLNSIRNSVLATEMTKLTAAKNSRIHDLRVNHNMQKEEADETAQREFNKAVAKMRSEVNEALKTIRENATTEELVEHDKAIRPVSDSKIEADKKAQTKRNNDSTQRAVDAQNLVGRISAGMSIKEATELMTSISPEDMPSLEDVSDGAEALGLGGIEKYHSWPIPLKRLARFLGYNPDSTPPTGGGGGGGKPNASFSKQSTRAEGNTRADQRVENDVKRRFGDAVDLLMHDLGVLSGKYTPAHDDVKALLEVSIGALDQRESGSHESWHHLEAMLKGMGAEGAKVLETIHRTVMSDHVLSWVKEQLIRRGENPNDKNGAFSQLGDPSEVASFAFQFYTAEGKIPAAPVTKTIFKHILNFIKRLAGITTDLQRTNNFFQFFDTGEFLKKHKNPEAVLKGLGMTQREEFLEKLNEFAKPFKEALSVAFAHHVDRIHALNIKAYSEIVNNFTQGGEGYAGYNKEQHARMYEFANAYSDIVDGKDTSDLSAEDKTKVEELISKIEQYKKDAGCKTFNLNRRNFPLSFSAEAISGKLKEFKYDLRRYGGMAAMTDRQIDVVVNELLLNGYSSKHKDIFANHRDIHKKWAGSDLTKHAFSYIKQSTSEAEMARAFKGKSLEELLTEGDKSATTSDKELVRAYIDATTGKASLNMSPALRELFGSIITATNIAMLPFAMFSQMMEPFQLAFRNNSLENIVGGTMRGIKDIPRMFKSVDGSAKVDNWEKLARKMGIVAQASAMSMMSEIMSDVPMTGRRSTLNSMFFRYNGMEMWNRSMHVAATQNAFEFIARNDKSKGPEGARLLNELGLARGAVKYDKNGIPDADNPLVRAAVLRFVNESMAHPDASTNTAWMNDPNFALFAHMKRFTFGFSYYIHGRMMNDLSEGRYKALLPMVLAVPWMILVDTLRDMVKPGDEAYKANWGVSDYVVHGMSRAGYMDARANVFGDINENLKHGGSGVEALSPSVEEASKVYRSMAT